MRHLVRSLEQTKHQRQLYLLLVPHNFLYIVNLIYIVIGTQLILLKYTLNNFNKHNITLTFFKIKIFLIFTSYNELGPCNHVMIITLSTKSIIYHLQRPYAQSGECNVVQKNKSRVQDLNTRRMCSNL